MTMAWAFPWCCAVTVAATDGRIYESGFPWVALPTFEAQTLDVSDEHREVQVRWWQDPKPTMLC